MSGPALNAPCPCKSGRKYKRCCGREAAFPLPSTRVQTLTEEALDARRAELEAEGAPRREITDALLKMAEEWPAAPRRLPTRKERRAQQRTIRRFRPIQWSDEDGWPKDAWEKAEAQALRKMARCKLHWPRHAGDRAPAARPGQGRLLVHHFEDGRWQGRYVSHEPMRRMGLDEYYRFCTALLERGPYAEEIEQLPLPQRLARLREREQSAPRKAGSKPARRPAHYEEPYRNDPVTQEFNRLANQEAKDHRGEYREAGWTMVAAASKAAELRRINESVLVSAGLDPDEFEAAAMTYLHGVLGEVLGSFPNVPDVPDFWTWWSKPSGDS